MKERGILLAAFAAAVTAAFAALAFAASSDKTTGGGKTLVQTSPAGATGAVGVTAMDTDSPRGRVNINIRNVDGTRNQHFVGRVTDYRQDGNRSWICGEVQVLQLGTNTNTGEFFEVVVMDNGNVGDMLNWYRQADETDCDDSSPNPDQLLTSGNLVVHQG